MQTNTTYYVYIITNASHRSLYTGVTNSLERRLEEHFDNLGNTSTWAGRYRCHILVHYEEFKYVLDAIAREKQLKRWSRKKKEQLIARSNPEWKALNDRFTKH